AVMRAPVAPSGWPREIPPPFGLTFFGALFEARITHELQCDRSERFVDLDHGHIVPGEAGTRERRCARLRVAVQHPVGIDTCETEADKARSRLETEASSCAFARDENSRGAV